MKLTRRDHHPERPPKIRAAEALASETPQAELLFDPQEFIHSFPVEYFKRGLRRTPVGERELSPAFLQLSWLAQLDPELIRLIKEDEVNLKKQVAEDFIRHEAEIKDWKDKGMGTVEILRSTIGIHERLVSTLQLLCTATETRELIAKFRIDYTTLLTYAKTGHFIYRLNFARILVYEFPQHRKTTLSALFDPSDLNPQNLIKRIQTFRPETKKSLWMLVELFPELRDPLRLLVTTRAKELRTAYEDQQAASPVVDQGLRFFEMAHELAILSAERTWIDEDGKLQFEFQRPTVGGTTTPLPDRPLL